MTIRPDESARTPRRHRNETGTGVRIAKPEFGLHHGNRGRRAATDAVLTLERGRGGGSRVGDRHRAAARFKNQLAGTRSIRRRRPNATCVSTSEPATWYSPISSWRLWSTGASRSTGPRSPVLRALVVRSLTRAGAARPASTRPLRCRCVESPPPRTAAAEPPASPRRRRGSRRS